MDGMEFWIATVSDSDGLYASELIWCDGDREYAWQLLGSESEVRQEARRLGIPARLDGPFTIGGAQAVQDVPAAPSVWIVQGEHFEVPGIKTSVHASHEAASAKAAELVNLMIDDTTVHKNSRPRRATPSDWAGVPLGWLQDYHGAAHCWVVIIETTLQGEQA